jgi:hypothetical protein
MHDLHGDFIMKTKLLIAATCVASLAAPAFAGGSGAHETKVSANTASTATVTPASPDAGIASATVASVKAEKPSVEIVSRGPDGRPDVVSVDGQTYNVCKTETQDSCINPRSAGLNFGARDLQYWPGRPASEISTPLPATPLAIAP